MDATDASSRRLATFYDISGKSLDLHPNPTVPGAEQNLQGQLREMAILLTRSAPSLDVLPTEDDIRPFPRGRL